MTENHEKPSCGQCGKPAIAEINEVLLCVDHWTAVQAAQTNQLRHQMAMLNYFEDQIASAVGLMGCPSASAAHRLQIPSLPSSPFTLNNFRLDNSTVGAINTGNVHEIQVSLEQLHNAGNEKAKNALEALTQAVLSDSTTTDDKKNELLEQVAFLSGQATVAAQDRKPGLIKPTLDALAAAATTVSGLTNAWVTAEPILRSIFG